MQFDEWDVSPVEQLPRSRLLAPLPFGVGTPMVEALASYLTRLAGRHLVTVGLLLWREFLPLLPADVCRYWTRPGRLQSALVRTGHSLSGNGAAAKAFASATAELTLRSDIGCLTRQGLAGLPDRGLVRASLAYCPSCLDGRLNDFYIPLLWTLKSIAGCANHRIRLLETCPRAECGRLMPVIAYTTRVGFCPYCGTALGRGERVGMTARDLEWLDHVVEQLSPLLASETEATGHGIQSVVVQVADHYGDRTGLARLLGSRESIVTEWCAGRNRPTLEMLLRLCWIADLELVDVMHGRFLPGGKRRQPVDSWSSTRRASGTPFVEVEHRLDAALADPTAPSLKSVLAGLHRSRATVAAHFPTQVAAIKARHAEASHQAVTAHRLGQDHAISNAVQRLVADGARPSRRNVQGEVGFPIRKRLMGVWQEAVTHASG